MLPQTKVLKEVILKTGKQKKESEYSNKKRFNKIKNKTHFA